MAKVNNRARPRDCRDWHLFWRYLESSDKDRDILHEWQVCRERKSRCWMVRKVTVYRTGSRDVRSPGISTYVPVETGHVCYGLAVSRNPDKHDTPEKPPAIRVIAPCQEVEPQVKLEEEWFNGRSHLIQWPAGVFALDKVLLRACRTRKLRSRIQLTSPPSEWIVPDTVPGAPAVIEFCVTSPTLSAQKGSASASRNL